jgi:hypothetical protein
MATLLAKSNWWKTAVINAALRSTNFTAPTSIYIALYTSDPTGADTGTEVSGGGYVRQLVTFGAPVINGGVAETSNSADVDYPIATADWGQVTHVGIRSAVTGGNLIYRGELENPRTILTNDRLRFMIGQFVVDEG